MVLETPNAVILGWAQRILVALNAPRTQTNMAILSGWIALERTWGWNGSWNNPMATTWKLPGSTTVNSAGVQSYATVADGLQATLNTLNQTAPSYGVLVNALKNSDANAFWSAAGKKELATWGGNPAYPSEVQGAVQSVGTIPSAYLTSSAASSAGGSSAFTTVLGDLKTGGTDLVNLLGLGNFINTSSGSGPLLVGLVVGVIVLALVVEGAANV